MRKTILIAGLAMLCMQGSLFAQTILNWATSFSPFWANGALSGNATNISGNGINCTATISMTGPGAFTQALGSSGAQTPTVSGAVFTVPGTTNRIQLTPNFNQNSSYTTLVLNFSTMTNNINFKVVDIDKSDANSTTYFDRVTITASDGTNTYNPTITKYDAVTDPNFLVISGNTARVNSTNGQAGNTASDAGDQRGTINVSFGAASVNSVTIRYDNAPGCDNNPASQSIAIGAITFSQITLPVSLTDFSGHREGQDVLLNWVTRQEFNSASFEIERSTGGSWEKIGLVAAAGYSNNDLDYSFRDINPQGSLLLYRLRQVDMDNNFKYSPIVRISSKNTVGGLQAYPNPFREQVSIGLGSPSKQNINLTLRDVTGRIIRTETKTVFAGENNILLSGLGHLAKGIYQVILYDAGGNVMGSTKLLRD